MTKTNIQDALARAAKAPADSTPKSTKDRAARAETKLVGGHFPAPVAAQLRLIAAEEEVTIQSLLAEALDDLFTKKGKARIASNGGDRR